MTQTIDEIVQELNQRHFVAQEGGKTRVYNETRDRVLKRDVITCSTFEDFKNKYCNRYVELEQIKRDAKGKEKLEVKLLPAGKLWIDAPERRQYEAIVFNPGNQEAEDVYNLWRGFDVEPSEDGSWELLQQHLLDNVCCGDESYFNYLLDWMANAVQHPDQQANVAVVLKGKRGGGKGTAIGYFAELFGQHHIHVFSPRQVTGNFNYHLRDAVVLFSDEAIYAGNKAEESVLKGLITEKYLPIEGKHRDLIMVKNCLHVLIATNSEWAVPAGLDERRFFVLNMKDDEAIKQNSAYFSAIKKQMNSGGRAKMLFDLQRRDIKQFDSYKAPNTAGLLEQKIESLNPVQAWWYNKLCDGKLFENLGWTDFCPKEAAYIDYIGDMKATGHSRYQAGNVSFGMQLQSMLPEGWPKSHRIKVNDWFAKNKLLKNDTPHKHHYEFPPLAECRAQFEKVVGHKVEWPADLAEADGRAAADIKQAAGLERL